MDPQLQQLLQQHAEHFSEALNGKILCTLNGHAFPARFDVLNTFMNGSKYKKLAVRAAAEQSLSKYEPFIVQSRNFPLMLYCALTGQLIDKNLEAVKLHMKGKRFQAAQARFQADELELRAEPTLESLGVRLPRDHPLAAANLANGAASNGQQQQAVEDAAEDGEQPEFWQPEEGSESLDASGDDQPASDGEEDMEGPSGSDEQQGSDDEEASGDPMQEDSPSPSKPPPAAAAASGKRKVGGSGKRPRVPASSNGVANVAAAAASGKRGKAAAAAIAPAAKGAGHGSSSNGKLRKQKPGRASAQKKVRR